MKKKKVFSLHRKFSLYNFASAIVPVFLAFLLSMLLLLSLLSVLTPSENVSPGENDSPDLLNGYICQFDMRIAERHLKEDLPDRKDGITESIYRRLEKKGLAICVRSTNTVYYITEGHNEDEFNKVSEKYGNAEYGFFFVGNDVSEVCDKFYTHGGEQIDFVMFSTDGVKHYRLPSFFRMSASTLLFTLISFVLIAVFADIAIVRSLTRSIMKPIDDLNDAVNNIKHGRLDDPVNIDRSAVEINRLCENVDEVRKHLKASIEERNSYEKNRRDSYSNISHDARTAITALKGYTQGLMEGVANTPEKQARYYDAILNSTLSLEKLSDALSETVNLENGNLRFRFKERNMHKTIMEWFNESKNLLETRNINLSVMYYCENTVYCNIDTFQFERVIDNLFSNSLKYKKPENECVNISVIAKKSNDEMFEIIYSDDGIGIKPEESERIFERFYRADEARSNVQNGNGIGLTIVRQIVTKHSGTITAEGDVGKGLTLILKLPITREEESESK